ncbi:MAG: cytochrome P450 [Pseudomonadota bacterium]
MSEATPTPFEMPSGPLQDPIVTPLAQLDVSDSRLYQDDAWRPYFDRLRAEAPVHKIEDSPFGPFWSISRHQDIIEVERNHQIFSSFPTIAIGDSPSEQTIENFIAMDPPRHEQQRKTVAPVVSPRNLENLAPVIRGHAADILDNLPADGIEFDWVDTVSIELTTRMLATLFDFPFEDRRKLTYWSDLSIGSPETTGAEARTESREDVQAAFGEMGMTFMTLWNERANADPTGRNDLITMLAHGEGTRDMASRPLEFLGNIMLLIVGGNDTTRNSISGGILAMNEFPNELKKVQEDRSLIPNMVSEIIRWQTPVIHMRRSLKEDFVFNGQAMKAGDKVVLWYISANRDESVHPNADTLVVDRPEARQHASFGFGIHRCMGNRLAEMQLTIIWEEILNRFTDIRISGPVTRLKSNFIRGIRQMPVVLTRR